jgi:hypothetical protein
LRFVIIVGDDGLELHGKREGEGERERERKREREREIGGVQINAGTQGENGVDGRGR